MGKQPAHIKYIIYEQNWYLYAKNYYRFLEIRDNPVIGTIYLKKSILKKEPKKIKVAIEWEKCDKCFITSNAQSGIRVPFFMSHV